MNNRTRTFTFQSALAPWIETFIAEKQACGYKYSAESEALQRLDRFLHGQGLETAALPRALVERWIAKDPNESPRTQRARIGLVRRLATFLLRHGRPAYVPDARLTAREPSPSSRTSSGTTRSGGSWKRRTPSRPTHALPCGIASCRRSSASCMAADHASARW